MFIEQTLSFIEGSDLEFSWPDIRPVQIEPNGGRKLNLNFSSSISVNRLKDNHLLSQMAIFSLFDALIDINHPDLEGQSFKRRYEQLPVLNNRDQIFKEIYRILKLLRNATIHNRSSLNIGEHGVELSYTNRGTSFDLRCSKRAVTLLNTIVVLFIKTKDSQSEYANQYLYSYFNKLVSEISLIADEFSNNLNPISGLIHIETTVRYRITNTVFNYDSDNKEYKLDLHRPLESEPWASDEYLFSINGVDYLVPGEVIGDDGSLPEVDLPKWKMNIGSIFQ